MAPCPICREAGGFHDQAKHRAAIPAKPKPTTVTRLIPQVDETGRRFRLVPFFSEEG